MMVKDWLTATQSVWLRAIGKGAQFPEPAHQITSVPCRPR